MNETALSVEVEHDYLPEWNRMLPLPMRDDDDADDEDRRLARGARLRLWRSGPRKADELRPAVEAEVAGAVEAGEVAADDAAGRIDRVCLILASDATIAEPPNVDGVALELQRGRELFANFHGPWRPEDNGPPPPVPYPDRYGNWPGEKWREAVEYSLGLAGAHRPPNEVRDERGYRQYVALSTSERLAWLLLRQEKWDEAKALADAQEQGRRDAAAAAVADLPIVFEPGDERQNLLRLLVRFHARGDLVVPVSGDPLAESKLMTELERNWDGYGLSQNDRADVVAELIRYVASRRDAARESRVVPTVGYAIVVDGHGVVTDVSPGGLRLTVEGGRHVLRSPRWPRPVSMSSREFRDPKRCAQAIYDQVGVEVDDQYRRHWKRWWPSLAAQLLKTVEVVEGAERHRGWLQFVAGVIAAAPRSSHCLPDGAPYLGDDGKPYVSKTWLIERALADGVIGPADRKAFSNLLGTHERNRRDAEGRQHKLLAAGEIPLVTREETCQRGTSIGVAGSNGMDLP
jgi:hypothetical protein